MNEFDKIERSIKETLQPMPKDADKNGWFDMEWTKQILLKLCNIGKEYGFQVCTLQSAAPEADWGEWLYDMTWLQSENNYLIEIPLVLECEWGEVDPDFQKLLQARALHRVMIFQGKNVNEIQEIIKGFKDSILKFKDTSKNDRYLFAAYNIQEKQFKFELLSPKLTT